MINALLERRPRLANWLYGFTPPERGVVLLVHRRVYIVPTQLGWLFVLTLAILLVGSINYALSLGFALTFLLAGMGLAGMVHTARNLARMAVSVGRADPVFAGEAAQFRVYLDARCLVYPKPERSALPQPSAESARGALRSPTPGNDDYAGMRAYQLSDSPRHVAWKAVARSDDMLTKQFTGEAAAELWLDWRLLPARMGAEQRLSRLAGWVLAAERTGAHYGLRLPGLEIAPRRGDSHSA